MKTSNLKTKVLNEIENLVVGSTKQNMKQEYEKLHIAILKNHYNAAEVSIDYHRNRVKLNIIVDDNAYDPKKVNLYLPTLHANLRFKNLTEFLNSCIDKDSKSIAIYAALIKSFKDQRVAFYAA